MAIKPYPKNRKYTKLLPEQTLERAYLEINGSYAQVWEPTRYNIKEHTRTTPQRKFVRYDYGD